MKKSKWNIVVGVLWLAACIFVLTFLLMPGEHEVQGMASETQSQMLAENPETDNSKESNFPNAGTNSPNSEAAETEAFEETESHSKEESLVHNGNVEETQPTMIDVNEEITVYKNVGTVPVVASSGTTEKELRGVWISYLEWNEFPADEAGFKQRIDQIYDHSKAMGMNAVFVHVRPDSDAMYPSAYFPWSKFVTGVQGQAPSYDPLAYLIEAAHARDLEFHAWINPYRVTGYLMGIDELSQDNPARQWLSNESTSRNVLLHEGFYYYNPSVPEVKELIINGVAEIVQNYQVDGIHFDDYFYPTLNDGNSATWFDKPEYEASGSNLSITQWRRNHVSELVAGVYQSIKAINPEVTFGISPAGFVDNLRSDNKLFVDIDLWMSQPGYIDYIMPQLYWGFEAKKSDKSAAPYAYQANLNTWIELKNKGDVTLYLGLAMSRAGTDVADNNTTSEWIANNDILKRQVEMARASGEVSGYCFFSYRSFLNDYAQGEVANLLPILR